MNNTPNIVLEKFLSIIASSTKEELLPNMKRCGILTRDFETRYIVNNFSKSFKNIIFNYDCSAATMDAEDGSLYRIEIGLEDSLFKIRSFMFQCQGCFGAEESCNVCGGRGWGVL